MDINWHKKKGEWGYSGLGKLKDAETSIRKANSSNKRTKKKKKKKKKNSV